MDIALGLAGKVKQAVDQRPKPTAQLPPSLKYQGPAPSQPAPAPAQGPSFSQQSAAADQKKAAELAKQLKVGIIFSDLSHQFSSFFLRMRS